MLKKNFWMIMFTYIPVVKAILQKLIAYACWQIPLDSSSVDVSVFCLSLMGTNYPSYLKEAYRVLKPWSAKCIKKNSMS